MPIGTLRARRQAIQAERRSRSHEAADCAAGRVRGLPSAQLVPKSGGHRRIRDPSAVPAQADDVRRGRYRGGLITRGTGEVCQVTGPG